MAAIRRGPSLFVIVAAGTGMAFLILPVLVIVPLSLGESQFLEFPPSGWSLQWYRVFFTNPAWLDSLRTSFLVAILATSLAVFLSTMGAVAIVRSRSAFSRMMLALMLSPMIVPGIITAIALYGWLGAMRLTGGFTAIVIGHTLLAMPFATISVMTSLLKFDTIYERASLSLGASPQQTFLRVVLPNILPGIFSGAVLAFVTSFDDVIVALFLGGRTMTLSRKIWEDLVVLVEPTQAAASTVILVISILMLVLWSLVQQRASARRAAQ
jgi:ABC-type spermidine/putrescine transport system permease subunit II